MINKLLTIVSIGLFIIVLSGIVQAQYKENTIHILTIDQNNEAHIKFNITVFFSNPNAFYNFKLYKSLNFTNFKAYDNNSSLNYSIQDFGDWKSIIVNYPRVYNKDENYSFFVEFDNTGTFYLPQNYTYGTQFFWSWGNASYPIELKYRFELPAFYDLHQTTQSFGKNIETNKTILIFQETVNSSEYFNVTFWIKKVGPPSIRITETLDKNEIQVNENALISISITNVGTSVAKNISIKDDISPFFQKLNGESSWFGDIDVGETRTLQYSVKAINEVKNQNLQVRNVIFSDSWNSKNYTAESNINVITIKGQPKIINLFGTEFPLPPTPKPFNDPSIIFYTVFLGYVSLLWSVKILKNKNIDWRKTHTIDRVIYSIVTGSLNIIFAACFFITLIILYLMFKFGFIFDIISKDFSFPIIMLATLPFTAWFIQKLHYLSKLRIHILFYIGIICIILLLLQSS